MPNLIGFFKNYSFFFRADDVFEKSNALITDAVTKDIANSDGFLKSQLINASYLLPAKIVKDVISDENIKTIKEYNNLHKRAKNEAAAWESTLKKEREKVDILKNTLEEYEIAFNFVGLYDGFNDLKKAKVNERKTTSFYLFLMSIAILAVPLTEIYYIIYNIDRISEIKEFLMFSFIPAASIEVLLIYFFRIFLHNQESIKSQLLQIDLRRTLCQFIQSYTNYSKEIKSKDDTSLEKFENIIFSGIVSSDEKLPSTYDGVNQLIGLISKIKKT